MSVAAATPTAAEAPPLAARGVVKRFGPLIALDHADFVLRRGVHALLGENGAGKSTLVKILYGFEHPDAGEFLLDGKTVVIRNPADARRLGIGLVFQQPTLIPALTVTENIALFLPHLPARLDHGRIAGRISELAERYGLAIDPSRRAGRLSLPEQQRVEIVRLLLADARILIFDEPTSTLPAQEIDALFAVFRRLREDGYPIVLITHKLAEVFALADTVTVMRRGKVVANVDVADVDEHRLVELMFGEDAREAAGTAIPVPRPESTGKPAPVLEMGDLEISPGEIVGVAGIAGSGQRELACSIVGLAPPAGRRLIGGEDATKWSVRRIREAGVGFVPESALAEQLIGNMTLFENIALGSPHRFSSHGGLSVEWQAVYDEWADAFAELDLDLPEPTKRAGTLSGGNAQRFAVARELVRNPRLLVALYPTRGLDVVTTATVQKLLVRACERGCGLLLLSQDLSELRELSHRLLVMRDGKIVAEVDPKTTDAYAIGRLMTGSDA